MTNLFPFIACCPTLNVLLENDVKDKQGKYEGVYTFQGFSDGMDYWVDAEGENAIWHNTLDYWSIGLLSDLGSTTTYFYSFKSQQMKCPNNEGYVLSWKYWDGSARAFCRPRVVLR